MSIDENGERCEVTDMKAREGGFDKKDLMIAEAVVLNFYVASGQGLTQDEVVDARCAATS